MFISLFVAIIESYSLSNTVFVFTGAICFLLEILECFLEALLTI